MIGEWNLDFQNFQKHQNQVLLSIDYFCQLQLTCATLSKLFQEKKWKNIFSVLRTHKGSNLLCAWLFILKSNGTYHHGFGKKSAEIMLVDVKGVTFSRKNIT